MIYKEQGNYAAAASRIAEILDGMAGDVGPSQ
jgi:hypothetical protein